MFHLIGASKRPSTNHAASNIVLESVIR